MRLIDADALQTALVDEYSGIAGYKARQQFYRAIELVRQQPTIIPPPNEALTLDELREMDGEPVWNDTMKKLVLVDAEWLDGIGRTVDSKGKWRELNDRYYRRKPEEGTT